MAITKFLDPSRMASRSMDQETFDAREAEFRQGLPAWGAEVNATQVEIAAAHAAAVALINTTLTAASSLAAGGGSLSYVFDTATADADPGAGKVRFNNATQNLSTVTRFDLIGSDTLDNTSLLNTFDASVSQVKGQLTFRKKGDPRKFLAFDVTAKASPAGYRNFTGVCVSSSSANPFVAGDELAVQFVRTGDKGDKGDSYLVLHVRDEKPSGTVGGPSLAGMQVRALTAVKANTIPGAALSSNQIDLPAGEYDITGWATVQSGGSHQAYLYSVTGAEVKALGTTGYAPAGGGSTFSLVSGKFTLAVASKLELRHFVATGNSSTQSLGLPASSGQGEVYSDLYFRKLS